MMMPEDDPLLRQFPQVGSMTLGHKIRPHPVPNDNDHVAVVVRRESVVRKNCCDAASEGEEMPKQSR